MAVLTYSQLVLPAVLVIGFASQALQARPAIIHEQERMVLPEPYDRVFDVCLLGDELLVLANRYVPAEIIQEAVWAIVHVERQANGQWQINQELASVIYDAGADIWMDPELECDGSVGGFSTPVGDSFILERGPSGWQATSLGITASDVAVHGDAVAFGGQWGGSPTSVAVYQKDASGAWADVRYAIGAPGFRTDPEIVGPEYIQIAGAEIAASGDDYFPDGGSDFISDTQVFDLVGGSWQLTQTLPRWRPLTTIGGRVALFRGIWSEPGDIGSLLTRDSSGEWNVRHVLLSEEFDFLDAGQVAIGNGIAFRGSHGEEAAISVLREDEPRAYRHEATLVPSNGDALGPFSVEDVRVAATSPAALAVYVFELPETLPTPQRVEETFEDNTAQGWTHWGQTDWQVVSSGGSRVYRQLDESAGARAIWETSDGTDQSIQADVIVRGGAGPAPWSGLIARYTDPQNFYYLLADADSIDIRRMANGTFGPIATVPFNLALNRTYRMRLEAIGTRLRAYVDGELVAEALDDTHASGKAGLTMWRSQTDYDNVVVTSNPQTVLFADDFDSGALEQNVPWSTTPANAWSYVLTANPGFDRIYRQSRTSGSASSIHGASTQDQIVSAQIRPVAFNTSGRGSAGVILRYVDYRNFYYARLTDTNRLILGEQTNGSHRTIDQATISVDPNTTYDLRAEAIGSSLRVYVNGRLLAEGQDDTLSSGRYGFVTFEAAADFEDFSAVRP